MIEVTKLDTLEEICWACEQDAQFQIEIARYHLSSEPRTKMLLCNSCLGALCRLSELVQHGQAIAMSRSSSRH